MQLRYGYPIAGTSSPLAVPTPRPQQRIHVGSLLRVGDPKSASRAARTLVEFIESQLVALGTGTHRSRPQRSREVDPRLWLDERHWLAWTICGELVSVEEIEAGSMRSSPEVRRLTEQELPVLFAADRLVPSVIALYRGDSLDRGSVWRYIAHHDLRRALEAALVRAQAGEARLSSESAPVTAPEERLPAASQAARTQRTRHHPLGNFIAYRRPSPGEDLPSCAAILQLPPVPAAFPDRRSAKRFIHRMPRLGLDPADLAVARVIGCVEVEPVFRPGIRIPQEPEAVLALIRREPRVVLPELKAVWQPRYEQGRDGEWRLRPVQKRGTVRNRWNRVLLQRVTEEARRIHEAFVENSIRRVVGAEELALAGALAGALRVAQKAERRLPEAWLAQLGMERESLGPDWQLLARTAPLPDSGHWLRAPCEHGRPHSDGQRRRLVELWIDDLPALLEVAGMRPRFLLVKQSTTAAPCWVLSLGPICPQLWPASPSRAACAAGCP